MTPDYSQTYELNPVAPALPGVVYLCCSGASLYGSSTTTRAWAVPLHPNELMDGAVVNSGFLLAANFRDSTYTYQQNAVVEELYSRHGVDLDFRGIIFFSSFPYTLEDKEREAGSVVRMAKMLGADAAIISPISEGHGSVEMMMICRMCEEAGISTALAVGDMTAEKGRPGLHPLGLRSRRPRHSRRQPPKGQAPRRGQGHRRRPGPLRRPGSGR